MLGTTKRRTIWNSLRIVGMFLAVGFLCWAIYQEKARQWHIHAIMAGPIRANIKTGIFRVPTCPKFDSIQPENLREFDTVGLAVAAGYRGAKNCDDAIEIRNLNETEVYDPPESDHDDPRY